MESVSFLESRVPLDLVRPSQRVALTAWRKGAVHRVEITAKDGDQVRWFGYESPKAQPLSDMVAACEKHGAPLIRPFALGSPFDQAAWPCIAALTRHCLGRLASEVLAVLSPTTDSETVVTLGALHRGASIGEWQGVIYPRHWRSLEVRKLCAYLRECCGLPELAARIEGLKSEDRNDHCPF